MKKYVCLFIVTLIALAVIIMPGFISDNNTLSAEVYTVTGKDMDRTVTATGRLRYRSGRPVRVESAGLLDRLSVSNGDEVSEGDLLFTYYKADDAYNAVLSQYGGVQGIEALMGTFSGSIDRSALISEAKKYCTIESVYSPCTGTVTDISYSADDILEKNSMVLRVSDGHKMEIPVNINETYIEQISTGQRAEIAFSALSGETFTGEVTSVAEEAEQTSGITGRETTVEAVITLDGDHSGSLRAGYSASCTIVTDTDKDVLFLPYEYIRTDDGGDYVFIVSGSRAAKQYITTGSEYKEGTQILSGLKKGDRIIINSDSAFDGQAVTISDSGDEDA